MSTETSHHVILLLQVSKRSLILYNILNDLIHVCSPIKAGAASNQGTKFWCQQKCLVTSFICYMFQKQCLWSLILYIFFMVYYMYIAPGQRQRAPRGQHFDVNKKALLLYPFVTAEKSLWSLILYSFFFHDLIHGYSPRAWGRQPPGDKVLMSTETHLNKHGSTRAPDAAYQVSKSSAMCFRRWFVVVFYHIWVSWAWTTDELTTENSRSFTMFTEYKFFPLKEAHF